MTKTIDERIVDFDFDNKSFEKNAATSIKTIEDLNKSLKLAGADQGFKNVDAAARNVNIGHIAQGVDHLKSRISVMGVVAATVIQDMTRGLMNFAKQAVNTVIVDPIKSGFSEYELKISSIQTIMASTGEDLETVNKYLGELNTYADKTIYSFSDMTTNIGKFTNAGVSLDQAVAAIKGVANVAAVSGANSNEASRAMYNFAQALSAGYVKLIDWKSIELANMGTVEFKQQLIDAAVAAGTLKDVGDGMYETIGGETPKLLSATKGFNEALTDQWLTTDVLVNTLNDYADASTEIGAKATAAAQDVKSFTMLIDTLKEALQSGWAITWELILGDFYEAKDFFTDLSNILSDVIGNMAEQRNNLVQGWRDLGGRESLIDSLLEAFSALQIIVGAIKDAFKDIFPPVTAQTLFDLTQQIGKLVDKIKMASESAGFIRYAFRGLFALLDIGRIIIVSFARQFVKFLGSFEGLKGPLVEGVFNLSKFLQELRKSIIEGETFDKVFGKVFDVLKKVVDILVAVIGGLAFLISKVAALDFEPIKEFFSKLKDDLKGSGKFGQFVAGVMEGISKIVDKLKPKLEKARKTIKEVFGAIGAWFAEGFKNLDFNSLLDTINAGLLGGVLVGFRSFFTEAKKLIGGGLLASILLSIKEFIDNGSGVLGGISGILDGVKDTLKAYQNNLKADTLKKIAVAIAILAGSILVLSLINSEKLVLATSAVGGLFFALVTSMEAFSALAGGMKKMATLVGGIIGIATAIFILSGAIAIMSRLDPVQVTQGTLAIGVMLAELTLFVRNAGGGRRMIAAGIGMLAIADAMLILSFSINKFAQLEPEKLQAGLLAMAGSLALIAASSRLMPANLPMMGAGLLLVGASLAIFAGVLKKLSDIEMEKLKTGLGAIAALLVILAGGLHAMSGTLAGSGALLVASVALAILAGALGVIGNMPTETIGKALLTIAAAFGILALAGYLLAPAVPVLLGIAGAMLLLGVAALALGAGVAAFAIGLSVLATAGAAGTAALAASIGVIATLLPLIAKQLALAFVGMLKTIAESAPEVMRSILQLMGVGLEALGIMIPKIVEFILEFVTTLLQTIASKLPEIIQAGYDIIIAILEGIGNNIGAVVDAAYDIVINFMDAIGIKLPEVVDAGWNMMINFIDGLADSAEKNIPRMIDSIENLGRAIIDGVVAGLTNNQGGVFSAITNLASGAIDTFKAVLGIQSPSKEMAEQGKYMLDGLTHGIIDSMPKALRATEDVGTNIVSNFKDTVSGLSSVIEADMENDIKPKITPVVDMSNIDACDKNMQKMMDKKEKMCPLASQQAASTVAGQIEQTKSQPASVRDKKTEERPIQYNQYIQSPKAISRTEIYRQTRNQLNSTRILMT